MNPKPEGEGIIALRAHPKIRLRGDPFRVPPSGGAQFPSSFLPYNRPCFTRFHLESDRSDNRKTAVQKSAANPKLQLWLFFKIFLCYFRYFRLWNSCLISIHYSISYFNYRLISSISSIRD